jgi:copper chaperone NosL
MTRLSRLLTAAAALALVPLYFLPLWSVELKAPQYPEGIGMYITVSDIRGFDEFDLDKINGLNHYIGMRPIDPASFPELRYMPWIVGAFVVTGLLVALIGRRKLLVGWLGALVIAGLVGLADFYRWGHDYGHDLDPRAAIKVPGMAYQPPVIGRKQLLNFTAESWPASGGLLAGAAFLIGVGALYAARRNGRRGPRAAVAAVAFAGACAAGVQPIVYDGSETCAYCSMVISDSRFGSAAVTGGGRTQKFDSIECLAAWLHSAEAGAVRSAWVTDFARPGTLMPVEEARFTRVTEGPGSPMGAGFRAYSAAATDVPGEPLAWDSILEQSTQRLAQPGSASRAGALVTAG